MSQSSDTPKNPPPPRNPPPPSRPPTKPPRRTSAVRVATFDDVFAATTAEIRSRVARLQAPVRLPQGRAVGGLGSTTRRQAGEEPSPGSAVAAAPAARESTGVVAGAGASFRSPGRMARAGGPPPSGAGRGGEGGNFAVGVADYGRGFSLPGRPELRFDEGVNRLYGRVSLWGAP